MGRIQWNPQSRTSWFIQSRSVWSPKQTAQRGRQHRYVSHTHRQIALPAGSAELCTGQVPQSPPQAVLGVCSDSPRSWGYCAGLNQSPLSAGRLKGVLHKFSKKRPLGQRRTFKIPQKGTLRQSWLFLSADIRWHRYCQPLAHTSATLSSIHPSCWLLAICIWGLLFLF